MKFEQKFENLKRDLDNLLGDFLVLRVAGGLDPDCAVCKVKKLIQKYQDE